MRELVMELVTFARRGRVSALALLVPLTLSASPASAQDDRLSEAFFVTDRSGAGVSALRIARPAGA